MPTRNFLSEDEAQEYKTFLMHLTGIEPSISTHERISDTAMPDTIWIVSLRELELSADQQSQCTSYLTRLSQKRSDYLDRKSKEYGALSAAELHNRWNDRGSLDTDERNLLRAIVRRAAGIKPTTGNPPRTCPECGMVEDNCTCTRSWF